MINYEKQSGVIWFNGSLVNWIDANLHVLSHSLHFASAVFEGLRVYNGRAFKLEQHTKRLFESANLLDFKIPFSDQEINEACRLIILEQNLDQGYLRPIAWRGGQSMAPHATDCEINIAIAGWEWPVYYSKDAKMQGIRLVTSKWRRPGPDMAPTQAKASGLYQICTLAKHHADQTGFDDALMLDYRDYIAETTSSNIFFVIKNTIVTPIADCFLNGITRQTVIEIAKRENMRIEEIHLDLSRIDEADEVFVSGTAAEITPVASIDHRQYTPGTVTLKLMELYDKEVNC